MATCSLTKPDPTDSMIQILRQRPADATATEYPTRALGSIKGNKSIGKAIYNYAVDTVASFSFYTPINALNEIFIAGMNPEQSLKVRMAGSVTGLFSSRMYGKFRDMTYKLTGIDDETGQVKKALIDITSSLIYGLPMYAAQMAITGVDHNKMIYGLGASALSTIVCARPYGMYLDMLRRVTGVGTNRE